MYTDKDLTIRPVTEEDLPALWTLTFKEEAPEWKQWDAPYYEHKPLSFDDYLKEKEKRIGQDDFWIIEVEGKIIGSVSYYWEHQPSQWLEMGIGIFDSQYWSGGYGTRALRLWITHLFNTLPLVRVGFTTWSGNHRMMKVGEEARHDPRSQASQVQIL